MSNATKRYASISIVLVLYIVWFVPLLKSVGLNNWIGVVISAIVLFGILMIITKIFPDKK